MEYVVEEETGDQFDRIIIIATKLLRGHLIFTIALFIYLYNDSSSRTIIVVWSLNVQVKREARKIYLISDLVNLMGSLLAICSV